MTLTWEAPTKRKPLTVGMNGAAEQHIALARAYAHALSSYYTSPTRLAFHVKEEARRALDEYEEGR